MFEHGKHSDPWTLLQEADTSLYGGNYTTARTVAEQALQIANQSADMPLLWNALGTMGRVQRRLSVPEQALNFYLQSQSVAERAQDYAGVGAMHLEIGALSQEQGQYEEARQRYHLAEPLLTQEPCAQVRLWVQQGSLARLQGLYADAESLLTRALDRAQGNDCAREALNVRLELGILYAQQGRLTDAERLLRANLTAEQALEDKQGRALALLALGNVARQKGDTEGAIAWYQECWPLFEALGDVRGQASVWQQYGNIYLSQNNYVEARRHYDESLRLFTQSQAVAEGAGVLHNLGMVAFFENQFTEAEGYLQRSLAISRLAGSLRSMADTLLILGDCASAQARPGDAEESYRRALMLYDQTGDTLKVVVTLFYMGQMVEQQGRLVEAEQLYLQSGQQAAAIQNRYGVANATAGRASVYWGAGRVEEACVTMSEAARLFQEQGASRDAQDAWQAVAQFRTEVGEAVWAQLARKYPALRF